MALIDVNYKYMDLEKKLTEHFEEDKKNFKLIDDKFEAQNKIHRKMNNTLNHIVEQLKPPTDEEKEEQEKIFDERIEQAMKKAIYGGGRWSYQALIVIAVIVGSVITIFGGFRWFAGLLGFTRIP